MASYDYLIIGGGILGLSTAVHVARRFPSAKILVLEKESSLAQHQTGRNSGVIHSGIYYKPGSYKARFAQAGANSMVAFCKEHDIPHDICGKLIVATRESELVHLENLYKRGLENGVPVEKIAPERAREIEPHVQCIAALSVKSTGITNYPKVCEEYRRIFETSGGEIKFNSQVTAIVRKGSAYTVESGSGTYEGRFIINCAGLHCDRIAGLSGVKPPVQIIPFRGEYYELVPERRHLVKTLIYPVPNPDFPFLGVHFTRMVDGNIHAGPNAVLAFAREGYFKHNFSLNDFTETLAYSGFRKMAMQNLGEGLKEMYRSYSKAAFTRSLQRLIPDVRSQDLRVCKAGIRAQAVLPDGKMVDDFLIMPGENILHVLNAPSPAATASLEIGKVIAGRIP